MNTRTQSTLLALWLSVMLMAGCQSGTEQTGGEESGPSGTTSGGAAATKKPEKMAMTIPAGTVLEVRLASAIDSGTAEAGNPFEGSLASALVVNGMEVASVGNAVSGKVTKAVSSGRLNRPAELALTVTSLTVNGGDGVDVATSSWSMKGESHKKRNIGMIGGGAGAGAIIGAIAGGKKGAAIGGAVGAGAGTGVAAATGKKEIQLAPEAKLSFKLSAAVTASVAH